MHKLRMFRHRAGLPTGWLAVGAHERWVRRRAGERGQAVVEFAIVIPVLLLVVFGILQFGILYNNYIQLTNAADAGGRLFSIERAQAAPCSDVQANVDAAAANLNVSNLVVTMQEIGTNAQQWSSSPSGATCPWPAAAMVSGDTALVTVQYPWTLGFLGLNIYTGQMSTTVQENIS
jgi:Flp pilus assembly protein TadG